MNMLDMKPREITEVKNVLWVGSDICFLLLRDGPWTDPLILGYKTTAKAEGNACLSLMVWK